MYGYDAPPEYNQITVWDSGIMGTRATERKYKEHSLVTANGIIEAYEDEVTGIITTNLLGFEALMAAKA